MYSVNQADRTAAIALASSTFDHNNQTLHDHEIVSGIDSALTKHIALLVYKAQSEELDNKRKVSDVDKHLFGGSAEDPGRVVPDLVNSKGIESVVEEISSTCEVIEAIYRCSADSVAASFARVGSELLPLIIQITNHEVRRRRDFAPDSTTEIGAPPEAREIVLKNTTKIIGHFARVGGLTQILAYHPGLLACLRRIIACPLGLLPRECRLNALWVTANLACNQENMVMMACHPGLIETLVIPAFRSIEDEEENIGDIEAYIEAIRSRDIAVRAIFNLSWEPQNKLLLSEHLNLVEALLKTLMYRKSSWGGFGRGVSGILLQSRRHASSALRNISGAPKRNKQILCMANGGTLLDKVAAAATNDPDNDVREKAIATLNNLACSATADEFVKRSSLLDTLTDTALAEVKKGEETGTALHALRILEKSVPTDMANYALLKPYLDQVTAAKERVRFQVSS